MWLGYFCGQRRKTTISVAKETRIVCACAKAERPWDKSRINFLVE